MKLPDEIISQLGKVIDADLARQAGCCLVTIHRERIRRGIPPRRTSVDWEKAEQMLAEGKGLDEIAGVLGVTRQAVYYRVGGQRKTARIDTGKAWDHLLGKWLDIDIARRFGVSTTQVWARRNELGISPAKRRSVKSEIYKRLRDEGWTLARIADRYGVSRQAVHVNLAYWDK